MRKNISKNKLYLLKEHSDIDRSTLQTLLKEYNQADQDQWKSFIRSFLLYLGIGLSLSGILFFFAFNWSIMPIALKFGSIIMLLIASTIGATLKRFNELTQEVLLLSSSILVGILFAVFGQVYQTGANAYDLFLIWSFAILPWVILSRFTLHWLLYAILINTTLGLYFIQVSTISSPYIELSILLISNILLLIFPLVLGKFTAYSLDNSYQGILLFACNLLAVFNIGIWLFMQKELTLNQEKGSAISLLLSILWISLSFLLALKKKHLLLFSYFIMSVLSIVFMLLIKALSFSTEAVLVYAIYAIGGVYVSVNQIIIQQKKWKNESE